MLWRSCGHEYYSAVRKVRCGSETTRSELGGETMEKERKQEQQVQRELQRKLERLKLQKKILNEIINSKSPASAVPHQLNANNEWHKIIMKRNEVLKKNGGKLEATYRKCLDIVLKSIREKLLSFLSMSPKEEEGPAAVTESSDSKQKEQYKSYGLLLSSCHIKKSELATDRIEYVLLQVAGRYRLTDESRNKLGEYVQKAVRQTRTMLTLLPPTVIYLPLHYNEGLHDTNRATWDEEEAEKNPKLSITHYRPVLLYGNHLHVAVKGLIGKKLESSKHAPPPPVTKTQTLSIHSPSTSVLPPAPPPPAVPPAVPLAPPPVTKTQTLSTHSPHYSLPPAPAPPVSPSLPVNKTQTLSTHSPRYPHPPPPPAVSAPLPPPTKPSILHHHVDEHQSHSSHSTTEPAHKPKGQRRNRSPSFDKPLSPDKRPKVDERVENLPSLSSRREKVAPSFQHSSATEQNKHKLQQNSVPSRAVPGTQYSSQPPPLVAYLPASQGRSSTQMIEKRAGSVSSSPVQTARASHQKQSTYSVSSNNSSYPSVCSGDAKGRMKREGDTTSGVSAQTTSRRTGYEYKPEASKGVTPPTTSESAGMIRPHKETKNRNNPAGSILKYNESCPSAKQRSGKPHSPSAVTKEKITGGSLKSGTAAATSSSHRLQTTRPSSSNKTTKSSKGNGIHSQSPVPASKQASGYRRQVTPQGTTPPRAAAVSRERVNPKSVATPTSSSYRLTPTSRPPSSNRNAKSMKENANPPHNRKAAVTISKQGSTWNRSNKLNSSSRSKVSDRSTPTYFRPKVSPRQTSNISPQNVRAPVKPLSPVKDQVKSQTTGHTKATVSPTGARRELLPNLIYRPKAETPSFRSQTHGHTQNITGAQNIPLPPGQPHHSSQYRKGRYFTSEKAKEKTTQKTQKSMINPTSKRPDSTDITKKPTIEQLVVPISPNSCQRSPKSSIEVKVQHELRSGRTYEYPTANNRERERLEQRRGTDAVLRESRGGGAVQVHVQKLQKRK
ncbi:PREDICTED: serine/arginine repetitive matrix protein 1-like [Amphimedon queenslandica]|uniref:Uncharacterized protein n=1 Tax=Amphimedon queenslandica TaxID=400682 RepID=A0A1X7VHC1_AMPQE|nr:PREDICTED: serine/arginine repetitive matrix protein 1-like [Amphimedon queenslandica]|eukprot:XP_019848903.1 PREDICTED: serine/arginine repetitive matrix protein 1-like [Amphimedon queenslandica]